MRDYADIKAGLSFYAATACDENETRCLLAAADAIEELLAELTTIRKQLPRWISVEERLPDNTNQQIVKHRGGVYFAYYNGSTWYSSIGKSHPLLTVTHWMPLPEPPKGVE